MNKTNIEWCDATWNPIVGCSNACPYCYAKKINDRFGFVNDFNKPVFFSERLNDKCPKLPKKRNEIATQISPDRPVVFVCSMGDFFGTNASDRSLIIEYIEKHQEALFMLLMNTVNTPHIMRNIANIDPNKRHELFRYPNNVALGFTLTGQYCTNWAFYALRKLNEAGKKTFVSIEPILSGGWQDVDFTGIDLVIVGAMTGNGKNNVIPEKEWIEGIKNNPTIKKVYWKKNIQKYL